LNITSELILAFPRTVSQNTFSKNPILTLFSINIIRRIFCELPLDSTSEMFTVILFNSSYCEFLEPRKECVNSISFNRSNEEKIINKIRDLTSFLVSIKVERLSATGLTFYRFDLK